MSKDDIQRVLAMYKEGYSLSHIGRTFGRDHTTIIYHCQKAMLSPSKNKAILPVREKVQRKRIVVPKVPTPPPTRTFKEDNEVVNRGKNYADYLNEESKRNWRKRTDLATPEYTYPQPVDKFK